jgi:hypothetical protein
MDGYGRSYLAELDQIFWKVTKICIQANKMQCRDSHQRGYGFGAESVEGI